jgi:hypothetical protein
MVSDGVSLPRDNEPSDHKPQPEGDPQISAAPGANPIPAKEGEQQPRFANCDAQPKRPKRDCTDIVNIVILFLAFIAAAIAACEADRLARLTSKAINHADIAAQTQHNDTLAALNKATVANGIASDAAQKSLRPYVFVDKNDKTEIAPMDSDGDTLTISVIVGNCSRPLSA